MKVYGGLAIFPLRGVIKQWRILICAKSQKRAAEIGSRFTSLYGIRTYWAVTGNADELAACTHEGIWMNAGNTYDPEFIEYLDGKFAE